MVLVLMYKDDCNEIICRFIASQRSFDADVYMPVNPYCTVFTSVHLAGTLSKATYSMWAYIDVHSIYETIGEQ